MPQGGNVSAAPQEDFLPTVRLACRGKNAGAVAVFILCWKQRLSREQKNRRYKHRNLPLTNLWMSRKRRTAAG